MKVTLMVKTVSSNVISHNPDEALRLFRESSVVESGDRVVGASVQRIPNLAGAKETVKFVEESGYHVLGYFEGLREWLEQDPANTIDVWFVEMKLEYVVDYEPALPGQTKGSVIGNISPDSPTDPNDQPLTPDQKAPVGATEIPSTTEPAV